MSYDLWSMDTGDLLRTHGSDQCAGNFCAMHNPSDHPLRDAVMKWDGNRNLMVRFCEHGIWHPDADDLAFKHRSCGARWASMCEIHKCDGCCLPIENRKAIMAQMESDMAPSLWDKIRWALVAFVEWVKSFF